MKIRNRQLYENLKNIINSAFKLLKEYGDKKPVFPFTIKEKVIFHKDGTSFNTYHIKKPNFHRFIHQHDKEILNLSEFKSFSDFFKNDERFKLLQEIEGKTMHNTSHPLILNFLRRLAESTGSFKFNIKTFNKLYEEYEGYLYFDIFNYQCFCLLMNFQSDIGKIRLNNGIIIKKISNSDRKKIWKLRTLPEFEFLSIRWIMHVQVNLKRGKKFRYQFPGKIFDDLITALRLFKVGIVGYKHIHCYFLSKWEESLGADLKGREYFGKMYILSKSEVYKFKKWWKEFNKLKGLKIKQEIEIAIRRFNYAYERVNLEDKLIDYVIAFESLLLTGESEKKFKFGQRGAFLLGKEIKDPKKRYNYMKEAQKFLSEAYNLRSFIVHGSKELKNEAAKINKKEVPMQTFIEVIEEYLRKSIKIYLKISTQKNKEVILKDLDDSIFNIN